jgi:hypothetical protein
MEMDIRSIFAAKFSSRPLTNSGVFRRVKSF